MLKCRTAYHLTEMHRKINRFLQGRGAMNASASGIEPLICYPELKLLDMYAQLLFINTNVLIFTGRLRLQPFTRKRS